MINCRYLMLITVALGLRSIPLHAQQNATHLVIPDSVDLTVRALLDQLKGQRGYRLAYSESYLNLNQAVPLPNRTLSVRALLDAISQATNTTYQVRGNQVIFRKKDAKVTMSGYVRDATSGEDLIGANVWNPRTTRGTVSNEYGFYSITLPARDTAHLRASYVGYAPQGCSLGAIG